MRRTRRAVAGAAVVLLLALIGASACTIDPEPRSRAASPATPGSAETRGLQRALRLPHLRADDRCPRTAGRRPNRDIGLALGSGPAYPVLGFEAGKNVVELSADERRGGAYRRKTLWAIDPEYDGPVLIRGRGINPPQEMRFAYDDRELRELEFPGEEADEWRYGASSTVLPAPGCYAFQVDGTSFSDVIVFEAAAPEELAANELTLEGKAQVRVLRLGDGRATARFTVTALDPPTHSYDVRVETAADADINVSMLTWYGKRLHVLDSVEEDLSCHVKRGRAECLSAFPALEAQRAGPWTVIVRKRTGPPLAVRVAVTFDPL